MLFSLLELNDDWYTGQTSDELLKYQQMDLVKANFLTTNKYWNSSWRILSLNEFKIQVIPYLFKLVQEDYVNLSINVCIEFYLCVCLGVFSVFMCVKMVV